MSTGLEWRERDGKRYLRADYGAAGGLEQRLELSREGARLLETEDPGQRVLAVIDGVPASDIAELARFGLAVYRKVYLPRRTLISVAGMPRSAMTVLRTFNALGGRGRLAGFEQETDAVDWLLGH